MDSRDSSSLLSSSAAAAAAAVSRDGSSGGDEDGIITVTSGLAKDAAEYFRSSRFNECLEVLNQLLQMKPFDPKVIHNIAVAESFRDGCSDPRKLLEVLNKVKKRSEDLAHAAGDQVESSSTGNSVISGSKGSSTTQHQFSANNTTSTAYMDEFDTSVAKLNIAVIFYHLHEYTNALSVLEPLYQNIEPIDEMTALQICLLLLDVSLASNDAARAADVIQYLEKAFVVGSVIGHGDGGSIAQHQSSNRPIKASSAPNNSTTLDISTADSNTTTNLSETTLARTLSDDTLDDDSFVNKFGQNLERSSGFQSSNDISRTSADRSAPAVDLKLKLHLYKVRLLLLTRNLKAAKREVKLAMNIAHGDSSTALLLKSQLEYARGNHRKAIKLLMTSTNRTESWMPSIFNNNFACIYHQLKKHHTSTLFFSKALKSSSSLRSEKPLKLLTFSQDKSLLIVYNCGLQYLACGKPVVAAHCFQKASLVFYNRPLLWLRIAECCLLALEKGLLKSSGGPTDEVRVHVIGSGKWRHLLVDDGSLRNRRLDSLEKDNGSLDDDGQMSLSITFARQCLLNALHLVNGFEMKSLKSGSPSALKDVSIEDSSLHSSNHNSLPGGDSKTSNVGLASSQANSNGDAKDPKGGLSPNTTLQSSVSIYEDICRRENNIIKQAILADLAYIELSLENPLKALMAAKSLLRLPECSRIYIFLGHIYAAEALCRLNRLKEAAEHLSVYMNGNNVEFPYSEEDREKFGVDKGADGEEVNAGSAAPNNLPKEESQGIVFIKPEEARGTLFISLASMFAMQGDLEQAYRFANEALLTIPNNPKAVLMSVYVDLRLGKSQDALAKLKQCSGVRFVPSGLTLMNSSS